MKNKFPVFLSSTSTNTILRETADLVPEGTKVYLFAGSIRNAVYFTVFGEEMTQRDFDCIVMGDGESFAKNLISKGFIFGSKNSSTKKILKKERFRNPIHRYDDWVYLDCKIFNNGESIDNILRNISDFTISGFALNIKDIFSLDWLNKIIAVPGAMEDLKNRKIRVVNPYSISIHKIIRLMSRDFQKPEKSDILSCIEKFKEITEDKFVYNTEKTIRYVGSKKKVLIIANELGITFDIFDHKKVTSL